MKNENLQDEINNIMNKNAVNAPRRSFSDKKLLQYESELISSNVLIDFSMRVCDICADLESAPFGKGQFKREDYTLCWKKWNDTGFKFVLTNLKYSNSKLLIDCPEEFKKDSLSLIPKFIEALAQKATQS